MGFGVEIMMDEVLDDLDLGGLIVMVIGVFGGFGEEMVWVFVLKGVLVIIVVRNVLKVEEVVEWIRVFMGNSGVDVFEVEFFVFVSVRIVIV